MSKQVYFTASEEETRQLAERFAEQVEPGTVLCLRGDLGVGKTVFAKGLCAALGVTDYVSSPTFTLVNEYEGKDFPVYHFDLYRIEDSDELYEIGFEEFISGHALSIIEWPERGEDVLPSRRIEISIERDGEDGRRVTVEERLG